MIRALRGHRRSLLSLTAAALLGAMAMTFFTPSAEAQSRRDSKDLNVIVSYDTRFLNEVITKDKDDVVRQVYAFPESPVFLVRTSKAITVWERKDKNIKNLLEIDLDQTFENIVFLDDESTFVVHTRKSAKVYSLNRTETPVEPRRR